MESEDDHVVVGSSDINAIPKVHLYKRRWFMLLMFSMTTLSNAALFATVGAINSIASKYYNVGPDIVNWLGNSFILIYVLTALPSAYFMTKIGLRTTVIIAASINAVASCLHFAGCSRNGFPFVIAGQIVGAFAVGYILNVPPKLAAEWFSNNEQSKATSIGTFANIAGTAVSFLQSSQMVPDSDDMNKVGKGIFMLYLSQLLFMVTTVVLLYLFFENKPLLPPTYSSVVTRKDSVSEEISFLKTLKMLAKNKDFQLLLHGFSFYFGMYVLTLVCLDQLLKDNLSQSYIGWIGFTYESCGIFGIFMSGVVVDKFKCFRLLSIAITLCALLSWVGITVLLLYSKYELAYFLVFGVAGIFSMAFMSHGVVQAMQMTYPLSESTTGAVMFCIAELYAFVFVLVLGHLVDQGRVSLVLYIGSGLYFVAFFLVCITKVRLKRQEGEEDFVDPDE